MTEEIMKKGIELSKKIEDAKMLTESLDNGYVTSIQCYRPRRNRDAETVIIHLDQELREAVLMVLYKRVKRLEEEFKEL